MPIYRFKVPQGSVPFEQREKIAVDVTDTHCGSTLALGISYTFILTSSRRAPSPPIPPAITWTP